MKTKTKTTQRQMLNWLLDAGIFITFLLAFFLNLTGLEVHQLIGAAIGAAALLHLVLHFDWVKAMTARLFGSAPARQKIYYALDGVILVGLAAIILTGVVLSTWLNLDLSNGDLWYTFHLYSSIGTLVLVAVKLGLHWRWIMNTFQRMVSRPARRQPAPTGFQLQPALAREQVSRRQFITVMGAVGLGAAFAIGNVVVKPGKAVANALALDEGPDETVAGGLETISEVPAVTESATATSTAAASTAVPSATATQAATATSLPTATTAIQIESVDTSASSSASSLVCTQRCPKGRHCSYPGNCRRYTDQNGNGLCDLGECS
jgi:hypothetical protein